MPKVRKHLLLSDTLVTALEAEALRQSRSLNNLIEVALTEWLEARK